MISIIVAVSKNGAIGKDNKLLFNIKEDLEFFKKTTIGKPIIMGRKTFESLPCILKEREHIVLTKDDSFRIEDNRVKIVNSVEDALKIVSSYDEAFVIGGGTVYSQFLQEGHVDTIYLTKINRPVEDADTFFPEEELIDFICVETIYLTECAVVYKYKKK